MISIVTPRRTIVHQHLTRQAVMTKDARQSIANRACTFIDARLQAHAITRMIVQHREGMASITIHRKMTLEVHLPQIVGTLTLKTNP